MKKLLCLLMSIAMMASMLTACGNSEQRETTAPTTIPTTAPVKTQISLDEYKTMAYNNLVKIYDSAVILNQAASYMERYWRSAETIGSTVTAEKLIDSTMEYLEENDIGTLELINIQYDKNIDLYKDVYFADIEGSEAESIKASFEALYDAYIGLYNLVTSPSGTRENFLEAANTYTDVIQNSLSKLEILLT